MTQSEFGNTLSFKDLELYFEARGHGQPLLLLHGFGGGHADFEHLFDLDALAAEFRLLIPDLRGHGRSTNPEPPFTHRQLADDVLRLLDHLALESVVAIGVSLGANTLLHLATRAPARVSAMVLVSATSHFPDQARAFMSNAVKATHTDEEWQAMRARHLRGDAQIQSLFDQPSAFAKSFDDLCFSSSDLGRIRARTLLVAGDSDPLYPVEISVEMWRAIEGAQLWVAPGQGHCPVFQESRPEFARIARQFIRGA